jgi:hypothetical protein
MENLVYMNKSFYNSIANSTAHRPVRDMLSCEVINNTELFPELLAIALDISDKNHHKACWVLELVLERNIDWLKSNMATFCVALPSYENESAIRSISKICLFCVQRHVRYKEVFLTDIQMQQITEVCFDWLISDTKVASKAYAMRTLYLIGKDEAWIHPELQMILSQGFAEHSPAYKAAAKDILKKMGNKG